MVAGFRGMPPYLRINLIFALLIAGIFTYSLLFTPERDRYPVPSFYELATGKTSPSNGLSRSFSEMIRLRIDAARDFNPEGPRLFFFFLAQLVMRGLFSWVAIMGRINLRKLVLADILLSLVLFLLCFKAYLPFWKYL